jgi:L-lactate dehydrogenase complex protein LldG
MESSAPSPSREVVLSRIRAALSPQKDALPSAEASWLEIPRGYVSSGDLPATAILELLTDRLRDYDVQVLHAGRSGVTHAVAKLLTARRADTMLIPAGFPQILLPEGFTYILDEELLPTLLDGCSGIITTCTLAIAETGTIVLQNAPGQGRRAASLVPDYHLCIIEAEQVVATVPEGIRALLPTAKLPTTFISGPSATADIEMTRIKGVHGPRFLDVILIA